MKLPQRNPQELTTFISDEAVQNDEGIPIMCNCSFMSLWIPRRGSGIDHMPAVAAADQLYRAGKFAEAEASYQAVLKADAKLVPAQVGLVRLGPRPAARPCFLGPCVGFDQLGGAP